MTTKNKSFMENFQEKMETSIVPVAMKIANQRHLSAIRDGMAILVGITIIGGFAMLIALPPVDATRLVGTNIFFKFLLSWKNWATENYATLIIPYNLTIGCISLYVVSGVSYRLATSYNMNGLSNMISALLIYLIIAATPVTIDGAGYLPSGELGAAAMFSAIIVAIVVIEINRIFIEKNICIKLPDAVPPNVAAPFKVLLPLAFNIILFMALNIICTNTTGEGLTKLVFTIFQPLLSATGSLPSILLINILMTTFWFFGIHGSNMVGVVVTPITTLNLALNAEAYAAGQPIPEIFAGAINSIFGNWLTYTAILITMLLYCKASQIKSIAKISTIPTIFNINEPMIFGLPTVLNIFTFIPLLICSIINVSSAYLLMHFGVIGKFFVSLPFTTPGPIAAFLATMDWKAAVLWFALLGVDIVVCLPFMKAYDKQLLKLEETDK